MLIIGSNKTQSRKPVTCGRCNHMRSYEDVISFGGRLRKVKRHFCAHPYEKISRDENGTATGVQPSQPPPDGYCPWDYGHGDYVKPLYMFGQPLSQEGTHLIKELVKKKEEGKL